MVVLEKKTGKKHLYKFLNICEFTSTRKRMSIITRRVEDGKIICMCKGADSVIYDRMSKESLNG